MDATEIINLYGTQLSRGECEKAGKWMAKAFADAREHDIPR